MEADDGQYQAQGLQRLADVLARQRVLLHDFPLVGRQIRAFFRISSGTAILPRSCR
jgi:hypothetical protein